MDHTLIYVNKVLCIWIYWLTETNAGNIEMQSIVGTINFSSIKMQHYKGGGGDVASFTAIR